MLCKNSSAVFQISRFLLILLFAYAALSKLINHDLFDTQLKQIAVVQHFAGFISIILPLVEFTTAFCLIFAPTVMTGLILSSVLMTLFTIYVGFMLLFSVNLPCTCGGMISQMTWRQHFLFNLFFMFLSWNAFINFYKKTNHFISANTKEVS